MIVLHLPEIDRAVEHADQRGAALEALQQIEAVRIRTEGRADALQGPFELIHRLFPLVGKSRFAGRLQRGGRRLKIRRLGREAVSYFGRDRGFSGGVELARSFDAVVLQKAIESRARFEHRRVNALRFGPGFREDALDDAVAVVAQKRRERTGRPGKMLGEGRHLSISEASAVDALKNPYVLEFLGLPDVAVFHESDLERAIITHLQRFLLELGNGFAFVARQKHIRIEEQDRYIDLVFYHCRLKFYLLIDLKVGELTHADVGQVDGYVRMFDDLFVAPDDNPTIGLILCTEKNETVARYSVLNDRKQIFVSKYMLCLPTEEQLRLEVEKEREAIEEQKNQRHDD